VPSLKRLRITNTSFRCRWFASHPHPLPRPPTRSCRVLRDSLQTSSKGDGFHFDAKTNVAITLAMTISQANLPKEYFGCLASDKRGLRDLDSYQTILFSAITAAS
jgi:hypothetical protein